MSKNTGNALFRKLNVNVYSDDEEEEEPQMDGDTQGPNEGEVQSLLSSYPLLLTWLPGYTIITVYCSLYMPTLLGYHVMSARHVRPSAKYPGRSIMTTTCPS